MARTLASCKLSLADVEPTLALHGMAMASAQLDRAFQKAGTIRTDSRKIQRGDIFLAYKGVSSDGHDHIATALGLGAGLLVLEDPSKIPEGRTPPWVQVPNGRAAWAHLAAKAFDNPQDRLKVLGVTGTNGKTSTAWMAGQLLEARGTPCLIVGTLGAYLAGEFVPTTHTTPDPDVLYSLFAAALDQGVRVVVMEVSSHAIMQEKVGPIRFTAGAFTSFSRDHLDFHGTMDEYFAAKWRFFTDLMQPDARMVFADVIDRKMALSELKGETVVYGFAPETKRSVWHASRALRVTEEETGFHGTKLQITDGSETLDGEVPYFAKHALENFCAALLLASAAIGKLPDPKTWASLPPVPGRLEQVFVKNQPCVIVDYAHTPDALEKTLQVVRLMTKGRLAVVFGCGGDRDKGKRPMMGKIASDCADRIYVTSDNPRTEDPDTIAHEIASGIADKSKCVIDVDRASAIARAVDDASPDDLIVVAGKGHEAYQIFKDRTITFDDREVAKASLLEKGTRC